LMKEIRRYIMGVDEGNRWSCQVCDYTYLRRVIMLFMEPSLISRYHPSSGESIGVKKTYPCLGGKHSYEEPIETLGTRTCLTWVKELDIGGGVHNPKTLDYYLVYRGHTNHILGVINIF
jgi:hypothetical protein